MPRFGTLHIKDAKRLKRQRKTKTEQENPPIDYSSLPKLTEADYYNLVVSCAFPAKHRRK